MAFTEIKPTIPNILTVESICYKDGPRCRYADGKYCKVPSPEVAQRKTVIDSQGTKVESCHGYDPVRVSLDSTP